MYYTTSEYQHQYFVYRYTSHLVFLEYHKRKSLLNNLLDLLKENHSFHSGQSNW